MDFGLSFGYVFEDKDWFKKIAIPALCALIPVIGEFVVVGWGLRATKNVIDGKERNALPELDFGNDLGHGFMASVIALIYSLPVAIVVGISGAMFGFATGESRSGNWVLITLGTCIGLLGLVLGIASAFFASPAVANYIAKGNFSAAFKFKEIFAMLKKSFVSWLLVILGQIIALGFIAPLGTIACGIGALLTFVYGTAVYSHLLGQAYNQSAAPVIVEVETT
ncbi:MAG: putative membrane protein [Anaerolinea thermophila]|uniref:Putative membrane protein n=1 Tax=Anaerolinea thermophila TaxID=167964 RepID=A0A101FXE0_9CHLR|nr:MAG: putative membrane protein [Anaerolinea thermophila]